MTHGSAFLKHNNLPPFPLRLRLGISTLHKLTSFSLTGCTFRSFRSLMIFVKEIPRLESLLLANVSWPADDLDTTQLPSCNASFAALRRVELTSPSSDLSPWAFAWLLAAPACGYQYRRRRGDAVEGQHSEIPSMMQIIKSFIDTHPELRSSMLGAIQSTSEGKIGSTIFAQ